LVKNIFNPSKPSLFSTNQMHLNFNAQPSAIIGVYREKEACQDFGMVLTGMVLGNRLMFGSVSYDKVHFEAGARDLFEIQRRYGGILERLIAEKLG
jgi:hypothetical protein